MNKNFTMNKQIFPRNCSAEIPEDELLETYLYIFYKSTSPQLDTILMH
jgi:hypothetical protein